MIEIRDKPCKFRTFYQTVRDVSGSTPCASIFLGDNGLSSFSCPPADDSKILIRNGPLWAILSSPDRMGMPKVLPELSTHVGVVGADDLGAHDAEHGRHDDRKQSCYCQR